MKQIAIRFDDKNYAMISQAAAEVGKTPTEYCRDIILNGSEASAMSTDDVKKKIDNIQRQFDLLQKFYDRIFRQIFALCVDTAESNKAMIRNLFDDHQEIIHAAMKETNDAVEERYFRLFNEKFYPQLIGMTKKREEA